MLLGIRNEGGGLGNNAEEIKTATLLMDNITIKPYQLEFIDAMNEILAVNDISLKLYFKTIQPLEFVDTEGMNAETKEEETGVKMSAQDALDLDEFIDLNGEILSDNWVLVDETEVDYDTENELDEEIKGLNKKSTLSKILDFASAVGSRPNAKSDQDKEINGNKFITRYSYTGTSSSGAERDFCTKMMRASESNRVYRKEDLENANSKVVNDGFGHNKQAYNIFLYKGGPRCMHKFVRKTFVNMEGVKIDVNSPNAKTISTSRAEGLGYRIRNPKEVAMIPNDMPNKGFHPSNKNKPKDA